MKYWIRVILVIFALSFTSINTFADEIKDTKGKLNDVKDSISEKKEMIEVLEKEKETAEAQLDKLDSKMSSTSSELENIKNQITATDEDILKLTSEIEEKEKNLEKEMKLMDARINAIYKSGTGSYLSVILDSDNISELLERAVFVKRIIEYDKSLIQRIEREKASIELSKSELEKKSSSLGDMKKRSATKIEELKNQSSEKNALIQSLEKDKQKYEKLVAEEEADAKALQEKIKKLEAQFKATNSNSVSITKTKYRISSYYGWRIHPVLGYKRFHYGIDIATPMGTPIYSLRDGVVIYSGVMRGYGNVVMVNHGDLTSLYAHNSSIAVKEGQVVKSGQLITYSGNSGLSSGPHLHFEIRTKSGDTVDPISYYK